MFSDTIKAAMVPALVVVLVGCSDVQDPVGGDSASVTPDSKVSPSDTNNGLPDGYKLWSCVTPGKACNAHDPCAVNPVCSPQKKCVPQSVQNCDDQLSCTTDTCLGSGMCRNAPKSGKCKLPVRVVKGTTCTTLNRDAGTTGLADAGVAMETIFCCFDQGDRKPTDVCLACAPQETDAGTATNNLKWSAASGGACDDGNACTKDDYCQSGGCKGTYYGNACADNISCTEDKCDGKGGCLGNSLKSGWCLINGSCYKDGANHPSGACSTCDASASPSAWTSMTNTCLIANKCYKKGDVDPATKCGQCDPAQSKSAWTPLQNVCLISGKCYKPGDKDSTGCGKCDPTTNPSGWTPLQNVCLISGKCYQPATKHSGGCAECAPKVSTTKWTVTGSACLVSNVCRKPGDKDATGCSTCQPTKDKYSFSPLTDVCVISGNCYKKGDKDLTGCGFCDPLKNPKAWTPASNVCLIAGKCYSPGAKHSSGCGVCEPTKNAKAWSSTGGSKITHFGFDSGLQGFTASTSTSGVGWVAGTKRTTSAPGSLYYGSVTAGNYASGSAANSGTVDSPGISLTASKKAAVSFQIYADTEGSPTYDKITVSVKGAATPLWTKTAKLMLGSWNEVVVDLTPWAGKTVQIRFAFDTVDGTANTLEGVYVDDVTVFSACSAGPADGGLGDGGGAPGCTLQNIATSATGGSSGGGSASSGYGPNKMNDGKGQATCNTNKFCWINGGSSPGSGYFMYTWPTKVSVHSFLVDTTGAYRKDCTSVSGRNLAGAAVQWWDGTKWVTDGTVKDKIDDWYYKFKTPAVTNKLRLYGAHATNKTGQKSNPMMVEWEVYTCK